MRFLRGQLGKGTSNLAQILSTPGTADAPRLYFANDGATVDQPPPIPGLTWQFSSPTRTIGCTIVTGSHLPGYVLQAVGMYCPDVEGTDAEWQAAIYEVTGAHAGALVAQTTAEVEAMLTFWNENTNFSGEILKPLTQYAIAVQNKGAGNTVEHSGGSANPFGTLVSVYGTFPATTSWTANGQYALYVRTIAA